jgi:hypothetical protein
VLGQISGSHTEIFAGKWQRFLISVGVIFVAKKIRINSYAK